MAIQSAGRDVNLYHKSKHGLMPPAYGRSTAVSAPTPLTGSDLSPFVVYPTGSWPEGVAAGRWGPGNQIGAALSTAFDFDPANDHQIHLFTQSGGGLARTQRLPAGARATAVARGDLNHDGRDDLAVITQQSDTLVIYLQQLGGALAQAASCAAGGAPDALAVGDFNGDLRDDLAVTHGVSQTLAIYHQRRDGAFAPPVQHSLSSGGYNDLAAGDLNGDGYADLAVLRGAGHPASQVAIFYQQSRTLAPPIYRTVQTGGYLPHGIAVGDVTGDGRSDIVVTAGGNAPDAYLNVFVQQGDGSLAPAPVVYPAYHLPEAVVVGDVNHDGRNDVSLVHAAWMALSVFTQAADGTLHAYDLYPLPYTDFYRPGGLDLGDVTGDGALDLLVASFSSLPAENGLVVLANSGDAPTATIHTPQVGLFITQTTTITVAGAAGPTAVSLQLSQDGGQTWISQPAAPAWHAAWPLPAVDGSYTLLVRAVDALGRVQSPSAQARVILDQTPPTGDLLINNGASSTPDPAVVLTLSAADAGSGVCDMQIRNRGAAWTAWQPFAGTVAWQLESGTGERWVEARFRDCAGNLSAAAEATIQLIVTAYLPIVTR